MSGHAGPAPVADISVESFPEYGTTIQDGYIDGYDPVSLSAPHSSLTRNSTWVAMGLILSTLFGIGLAVWGAGAMVYGFGSQTHDLAQRLLILGIVEAVVTAILGAILIVVGRKDYKAYRKRTGRVN